MEEADSDLSHSDIGYEVTCVWEDVEIIISDVSLGSEEQQVVQREEPTRGRPRVCPETSSSLTSDNDVEYIINDMPSGGSDVKRGKEGDESQELTSDSQELEYSPSTSTELAVSRKQRWHEGGGGIPQHYTRFLTSQKTGMECLTVSEFTEDEYAPPIADGGAGREVIGTFFLYQ